MTVGELRKCLEGKPDDMPVVRFSGETWVYKYVEIMVHQSDMFRCANGGYGKFRAACNLNSNNVKVLEIT